MSKFRIIISKFRSIINFIYGIIGLLMSVIFFAAGEIQDGVVTLIIGIALFYWFGWRKWKQQKIEQSSVIPAVKETSTTEKIADKIEGVASEVSSNLSNKIKSFFAAIFSHKKALIIAGITIVAIGIFYALFLTGVSVKVSKPIAVIDDLPIWLLRDGKVAVYQELVIFEDKVKKEIVVNDLGDSSSENIEIYEYIPKEIAQHASDLKFNVQPQIIENDPLVLWSVDRSSRKRETGVWKPVVLSYEQEQKRAQEVMKDIKRINELIATCKESTPPGTPGKYEREEAKAQEIIKVYEKLGTKMDIREIYKYCLRAYRDRVQAAQEQARQKIEAEKKEKITVVESTEPKYAEIQKISQEVLKKEEPSRIAWQTPTPTSAPTPAPSKPKAIIRALISKDIFPSTLLGLPLTDIKTSVTSAGCYTESPPTNYYSGIYKSGDKTIVAVAAQFKDEQTAKEFPKKCTDFTSKALSSQGITATIENKGIISAYPFSIVTALQDNSPVILSSFTTIADGVIQISIVPFSGTVETEHREAMTSVVRNVNVGCYGDSDCAGWVCNNCVAGQKICVQQECVACSHNSHCKDGYECKEHQCIAKVLAPAPASTPTPAPTPKPASAPAPSAPVCGYIDLSRDYKLYTYTVDTPGYSTICSGYKNNFSSRAIGLRCSSSVARWRNYFVKEVEVGGLSKVKITADLGLNDYTRFFTECSGTGVKYDDYSSLIVLSSNPKPALDAECNKVCSLSDWSKCGVKNSGANVLGHCGVAKCSASKKCDFEVNVSGLDKIYLVYHISDAWPADLEGTIANLQVCEK